MSGRIPVKADAFAKHLQRIEDRLDRIESGAQLRGHAAMHDTLNVGDVAIEAISDDSTATTVVTMTRRGGTPVVIATLT